MLERIIIIIIIIIIVVVVIIIIIIIVITTTTTTTAATTPNVSRVCASSRVAKVSSRSAFTRHWQQHFKQVHGWKPYRSR